jgi:hypothetical protein
MAGCPEKARVTGSGKSEGRKAMGALGRTGGKEDRGIPDKIRFRPEKKNDARSEVKGDPTPSRGRGTMSDRFVIGNPIEATQSKRRPLQSMVNHRLGRQKEDNYNWF